jgi:hypothetical protein
MWSRSSVGFASLAATDNPPLLRALVLEPMAMLSTPQVPDTLTVGSSAGLLADRGRSRPSRSTPLAVRRRVFALNHERRFDVKDFAGSCQRIVGQDHPLVSVKFTSVNLITRKCLFSMLGTKPARVRRKPLSGLFHGHQESARFRSARLLRACFSPRFSRSHPRCGIGRVELRLHGCKPISTIPDRVGATLLVYDGFPHPANVLCFRCSRWHRNVGGNFFVVGCAWECGQFESPYSRRNLLDRRVTHGLRRDRGCGPTFWVLHQREQHELHRSTVRCDVRSRRTSPRARKPRAAGSRCSRPDRRDPRPASRLSAPGITTTAPAGAVFVSFSPPPARASSTRTRPTASR